MLKEYVLFPASLNTNVQNCTPSYSCGIVFSLANILFSPLKLIMFLKWMSLVHCHVIQLNYTDLFDRISP